MAREALVNAAAIPVAIAIAPPQLNMQAWKSTLGAHQQIQVKNRVGRLQFISAVLGDQVGRKYQVTSPDGNDLMFAADTTTCCQKLVKNCFPLCAPYSFQVLHTALGPQQVTSVLKGEKDFQCTCCCFNRPTMHFTDTSNGQPLGSAIFPFKCFDYKIMARDATGQDVIGLYASCCQCGLCCPNPCCGREIGIDITDAQGHKIGKIQRKVPALSICCGCQGMGDSYKIDFGHVQAPEWKAMVLAMTLYLDYLLMVEEQQAADAAAMA